MGSNVTHLVDFTLNALLDFKMDVGVLVTMEDREDMLDTEEPAVVTVRCC